MKKLEKKQIPAVLACGAITVGALGYTSFQLTNQPTPRPTPPRNMAATPGSGGSAATSASTPAAGAAATPTRTELARFTVVPPSYRGDPFSPVYREEDAKSKQSKQAAHAMKQVGQALGTAFSGFGQALGNAFSGFSQARGERVNMNAPQLPPGGEWTPAVLQDHPRTAEMSPEDVMDGAVPGGRNGVSPAPQPEPAPRPQLFLTGVIQGDPCVAILRGTTDQERQVVKVNDRVAGRYVVKSITPEGILLASSGPQPDRWFLPLGDGEKQ
jgi:hypothetical protein